MKRWYVPCALWLALSGCASIGPSPCVVLDPQVSYCLQPPSVLGEFSALQQVELRWKHVAQTTLTDIESDGTALRMAVLTPMGQKLLELQYIPPLVEQLAGPRSRLDPAQLVALVQMALWPADSVRSGLRGAATWQEQAGKRVLWVDGATLLEVAFEGALPYPDHLTLRWPKQHLELDIRTLRDEDTL